jgi:hypothetical protein
LLLRWSIWTLISISSLEAILRKILKGGQTMETSCQGCSVALLVCPRPHETPAPTIVLVPLHPSQNAIRRDCSYLVQNMLVNSIQAGPIPASAAPIRNIYQLRGLTHYQNFDIPRTNQRTIIPWKFFGSIVNMRMPQSVSMLPMTSLIGNFCRMMVMGHAAKR